MNGNDNYLKSIIDKYAAPIPSLNYSNQLQELKNQLKTWARSCYVAIYDSGSFAKGTAISLASDLDLLVSLTSGCNENQGGLKSIFDSLNSRLNELYGNTRRQNVSVRINLSNSTLRDVNHYTVDVIPASFANSFNINQKFVLK